MGNNLFLGDFNWPHINWDKWCTSNFIESKFLDTLRKNFLDQHVSKPTRLLGVGSDTPPQSPLRIRCLDSRAFGARPGPIAIPGSAYADCGVWTGVETTK